MPPGRAPPGPWREEEAFVGQLDDAAGAARGERQEAVVRADQQRPIRHDTERAAARADAGVDHRHVDRAAREIRHGMAEDERAR